MNDWGRETAEMRIGPLCVDARHVCVRSCRIFAQKNFVPVYAEIGDDPEFPRRRKEFAGQIDRNRLRLSRRYPQVVDNRLPLTRSILHLKIRKDKTASLPLGFSEECASISPVHPAIED